MKERYTENTALLKALADINRLMIVDMLSCGELCACEILEKFNITQPTLSHHMKTLCNCGLVNGCKVGKWMYYSLDDQTVQHFLEFMRTITSNKKDCICHTSDYDCEYNFKEHSAEEKSPAKHLNIDFLSLVSLDLSICERCRATEDALDEAIRILEPVFSTLDYFVTINKLNITTEKLAKQHCFGSSPTIRVNGVDICDGVKESYCNDSVDGCGCGVNCQVFTYDGKAYEHPPTAMIVDGILRILYGCHNSEPKPYKLSENLKIYFERRRFIMETRKTEETCGCSTGCGCNDTSSSNTSSVKTLTLYEPAMCCPTGICGVHVDPELLRILAALETLKTSHAAIEIQRYNLTSAPEEFVKNVEVHKRLTDEGVEVLPIVVVDGKIVITKRYPRNDEFEKLLNLTSTCEGLHTCSQTAENDSCGCGCGETSGKKDRNCC
ncbi:MAG: arsenite efflux transporter metallochaperone ArsD [Methanomicrobiales archaeon]|nr:arsenite efflux transporter metallochaperone ArsD [Methanomicrobiales archaeon]